MKVLHESTYDRFSLYEFTSTGRQEFLKKAVKFQAKGEGDRSDKDSKSGKARNQ